VLLRGALRGPAREAKEEVGRILSFLGAEASEEAARSCLEEAGAATQAADRRGGSGVQFRKGVSGDWRNVFTEEDRRIFEEKAGDLLVRLGYEEDQSR
jgi:plasmid stabilization system protein ParE